MARLDWEKAKRRELAGSPQRRPEKPRGISNEQAKLLASLQRQAGERYSGAGLTAAQASAEISRLKGLRMGP